MEGSELIREIISKGKSALYDELYYERAKSKLISIIEKKALFRGEFVLASGKKSSYYLDLRRITLDSEASPLIGYVLLYRMFQIDAHVDAIAGPTMGADPLVSSAITLAPFFDMGLKGLLIRKQKKEHGLQKLIEGDLDSVSTVLCVEDVVTTGGSLLDACRALIEAGKKVIVAVPLVDREEENLALKFKSLGILYNPILKVSEILQER